MGRHAHRASSSDLLALAVICVWSVNVIVVKVALRWSPPLLYTAVRFVIGGLVLLLAIRVASGRHLRWPSGRDLAGLGLAGVLGIAVNQAAFTLALQYTTAVDVSLIIGATPLMVAAYGALAGRERIGPRAWTGLLVGAAGLVMVVAAGGGGHGALGGDLLALAAPAVWALYLDRLTRLLPRHAPLELSGWVTVLGAAALVPAGVAEGVVAPPHVNLELGGLLLYSALGAVAFANLAYFAALRGLGATRVAAYTYLQPFLGAVVAHLLLGESLSAVQLAGGVVVVAGVLVGRPRPRPVSTEVAALPEEATGGLAASARR